MKKLIARYRNGNYNVLLFEDGTKIRFNQLDNLTPSFAESMDIHITSRCDGNCSFCYANCTEDGKHGDLNHPIFETLHPGTEIALNGNDLSHPDLEDFLIRMKNKHVFSNLTVNQKHFIIHHNTLKNWQEKGLIYGLGVSLTNSNDKNFIKLLVNFKNSVLHVIDGLFTQKDIENLKGNNIKLLILGYKILGRGDQYYHNHKEMIQQNIDFLEKNIMNLVDDFKVISFDNLALDHLKLKEKVNKNLWSNSYMGDEGQYTFYLDICNEKFAVSSLEKTQYNMLNSVDEMFQFIQTIRER